MNTNTSLEKMCSALHDELQAFGVGPNGKWTEHTLYRSAGLGEFDGSYLYRFQPSPSVSLAAGVTVELVFEEEFHQGQRSEATIVRAEGADLLLSILNRRRAENYHITLWANIGDLPTALLEKLNQLKKAGSTETGLPWLRMLDETVPGSSELPAALDNDSDLPTLVARALNQEVSFMWAPAGTDAAGFAAACAEEGRNRGMATSLFDPTTAGVDEVVLAWAKAVQLAEGSVPGEVLRVGTPESSEARGLTGLAPFAAARQANPAVFATVADFEQQIANFTAGNANMTKSSRATMAALQNEFITQTMAMWQAYEDGIRDAKILFASLGATLFHSTLQNLQSDVVIITNAHRAWLPQLIVAASRARKHVILVGDLRHPSISIKSKSETAERWLKANIFEAAGITEKVNRGGWDSRLFMLRTQHSMHPRIARMVNAVSYGARLLDAPDVAEQTKAITAQPPEPGLALVCYDVGQLLPHAHATPGGSHSNVLTAALSLSVVRLFLAQRPGSILLIAPYGDQVKIHRALLRDAELDAQVTTTTLHRCVHKFHDFVILDLVDAAPLNQVGYPLQGNRSSELMRQLNAAFTSGRGKVIVLGDCDLLRRDLPENSALGCFLDAMQRNGAILKPFPTTLLRPATHPEKPSVSYHADPDQAWQAIYQDIAAASHRVLWNWSFNNAAQVFNENSLSQMFSTKVKRALAISASAPAMHGLRSQGVTLGRAIRTEAAVQIDDDVIWHVGMGDSGDTSRPFIRVKGERAALQISDLFGLNEIIPSRKSRPWAARSKHAE